MLQVKQYKLSVKRILHVMIQITLESGTSPFTFTVYGTAYTYEIFLIANLKVSMFPLGIRKWLHTYVILILRNKMPLHVVSGYLVFFENVQYLGTFPRESRYS
jgi:hypothetical protein